MSECKDGMFSPPPPLDVMVGWPPHRFSSPTELDVDNDVIPYLCCLHDGDVGLDHLDVDIRCLGCAHKLNDECVAAGSEALIYDDAEVAKGVWIIDGVVELWGLDVQVGCLPWVYIGDDGDSCVTDGLVALWCLDAGVAVVDCDVKVIDDYVVDGLAILDTVDGVFDVSANLDVGYVENDAKG